MADSVRVSVAVYDAKSPASPPLIIEVDHSTTVEEVVQAIRAESCKPTSEPLLLLHDGQLLYPDQASLSIKDAGVAALPVVVTFGSCAESECSLDGGTMAVVEGAQGVCARPAEADGRDKAEGEACEERLCRICYGGEYEGGAGRLVSPCLCTGSVRFVHVRCLNEWREASANPKSFYREPHCDVEPTGRPARSTDRLSAADVDAERARACVALAECDQCFFRYNLHRTQYAALFESERLVHVVAALLLLLSHALAASLVGATGLLGHVYALIKFDPVGGAPPWAVRGSRRVGRLRSAAHSYERVPVDAQNSREDACDEAIPDELCLLLCDGLGAQWGPRADWVVSGLLGLGATGVGVALREAWVTNRNTSHAWLVGLLTALANDGGKLFRILGICGAGYAAVVLLRLLRHLAKALLTRQAHVHVAADMVTTAVCTRRR